MNFVLETRDACVCSSNESEKVSVCVCVMVMVMVVVYAVYMGVEVYDVTLAREHNVI